MRLVALEGVVGGVLCAGIVFTFACADVPPAPTTTTAVVNVCGSAADCPAGALCERETRACVLCDPDTGGCGPTVPPVGIVYVISFPSTSTLRQAQGSTLWFTRADLASCAGAKSRCVTPGACWCVPPTSYQSQPEVYRVAGGAVTDAGPPGEEATIPVTASFRPLTPFAALNIFASTAQVPLPTLFGKPLPVNVPGAGRGPRGTDPIGFQPVLPFGRYLRALDPTPPFDRVFPPVVGLVALPQTLGITLSSVLPSRGPVDVDVQDERPGWRFYIRDTQYEHRISTNVYPAPGLNKGVRLYVYPSSTLTERAVEHVLEPPPGLTAVPSVVTNAQANTPNQLVPRLPAPVRVEDGYVIGNPEGAFVPATLLFQSRVENDTSKLEPEGKNLRYSTDVVTDTTGRFSVTLPPGLYDVTVVPARDTGFAVAVHTLSLPSGSSGTGRSFTVTRLRSVQGVVRIPGNKPLAGATVRAVPSIDVDRTRSFRPLSRIHETRTLEDGSFLLAVDPSLPTTEGTDSGLYDIVVDPPRGSRYPVTTVVGLRVDRADVAGLAPAVRVPTVQLGPPLDLGFTLLDAQVASTVVSGAFVRAFVVPPGKNKPIELASGMTDAVGRVDLYASMPLVLTPQGLADAGTATP